MSVAVNIIYTIAVLVATLSLDRFGRRAYILVSWAAATVLTLALAFVDEGNVVLMFALITLSTIPIQIMAVALFPMSVEPFPTLYRATAQGLSSASGKIGGFIASLVFPVALAGLGWTSLSIALAVLMAAGLVVGLLLKFPDPRGAELRHEGTASTG